MSSQTVIHYIKRIAGNIEPSCGRFRVEGQSPKLTANPKEVTCAGCMATVRYKKAAK